MPVPNSTSLNIAHRSLHFPRDGTKHGLRHITIVIIAVSASVGGVLVTLLFWRLLSRLSRNSRSAPLPPRQALVHQREQQLAAFTGHQNVSVPRNFLDVHPQAPVRHGSNVSLIPHVDTSSANDSFRASLYTHETDDGTEGRSTPQGNPLHPPTPHFFATHPPLNASSTSLPSFSGHVSEPTSPAATGSTSISPSQSLRRPNPRARPRPFSMVSNGTSHTGMTARSRSSMRGAPHAPHSNVHIVLPAPLAPNLYPPAANEHGRKSLAGDTAYGDSLSWRNSLADKWIPVGQHNNSAPKSVKRQSSHDTMERRGRQAQKDASAGSVPQRRSNSNPPPLPRPHHFSRRSLDSSLLDTPPVPRMPSAYGTQDAPVLLAPSGREALSSPPSSFPNSRRLIS
ncbi:hypothetical protein EDB89DRAFT_1937199 [Lactarius sanguifluus]|nr:hypothetical protein EDB89DRAFT_1937199 [Lactarius sanguifluus]